MTAELPPCADAALFIFSRATDVQESLTILDEVAAWLREQGVRGQWPTSFSAPAPGDVQKNRVGELENYVRRGQLWLLRDAATDDAVATFAVTDVPDPDFAALWPKGDAYYLHRMAVRRHMRGRRLGERCVDFAAGLAYVAGVRWLRLDCSRSNVALHAYYERTGFSWVGSIAVPGRLSGALFQRPVCAAPGTAGAHHTAPYPGVTLHP